MDRNEYQNPEVRTILKYWFYSRISGCVGLLFLFVALITPNWIKINSSLSRISLGLWSICVDDFCRVLTGHSLLISLLAILLFGLSVMDKVNLTDEEDVKDFHYSFSFSFIGSCVGCVLFFISGILFILVKIKESAMISPVCQIEPEESSAMPPIRMEREKSLDQSDSGIACAYGVM